MQTGHVYVAFPLKVMYMTTPQLHLLVEFLYDPEALVPTGCQSCKSASVAVVGDGCRLTQLVYNYKHGCPVFRMTECLGQSNS